MSDLHPPAPTMASRPTVASTELPALSSAFAMLAVGVPALLTLNLPPSSTFLNQAAAFIGWAAWLLLAAAAGLIGPLRPARGVLSLMAALALLCLATLASGALHLPASLMWSNFASIAAAGLVVAGGAAQGRAAAELSFRALCIALVVAGICSIAISVVQLYVPSLAGNAAIAATGDTRAVGNLRQSNHLSSLLLWSAVAALWLGETGHLRRALVFVLAAGCVFGVVISGSRTGVVGVFVLALWGLADRKLSPATRVALGLAPVLYFVLWTAFSTLTPDGGASFAGTGRFSLEGDISSSRFAIWRDTMQLIAAHPWAGVGVGEFNFAWSLTPFPQRPVAFFDHTHNLPLQLLVELGLPLGVLVLVLLAHALWRAFTAAAGNADGPDGTLRRAAFVMLLLMVLHSQLEYPLWYAYFLLPSAFLFGLCLRADDVAAPPGASTTRRVIGAGAAVMLACAAAGTVDYLRVAAIFEASDTTPLPMRIAQGQRSVLFAHHAHYAAATIEEHPSRAMPSFGSATHYLLDTRLMIAWATALNESGDVERARHIAQRLREFRNADSSEFFAPCAESPAKGQPLPFQCAAPTRRFDHRDFR